MYFRLGAIIFFFLASFNVRSNNLALPCLGCHANENSSIPNIKGLNSEYFIKAFKAYKNNERSHYLMQLIAKGYSDKQIGLLANYFKELK